MADYTTRVKCSTQNAHTRLVILVSARTVRPAPQKTMCTAQQRRSSSRNGLPPAILNDLLTAWPLCQKAKRWRSRRPISSQLTLPVSALEPALGLILPLCVPLALMCSPFPTTAGHSMGRFTSRIWPMVHTLAQVHVAITTFHYPNGVTLTELSSFPLLM